MKLTHKMHVTFKTLFLMLFLLPSITLAATNSVAPVKMDRIIAIVDQSVITEQELANRIQTVSAQLENKARHCQRKKC